MARKTTVAGMPAVYKLYRAGADDNSPRHQHEYVHLHDDRCWCCYMNVLHTEREHARRLSQSN